MIPVDREAYQLMQDGALALAQVEETGVRIDVPYLKKTIVKVTRRIDSQTEKLEQSDVFKEWKKKYGRKANLGSRPQLGQILFEELGYENVGKTTTGRYSTAADNLEKLDIPFVKQLIAVEKLKKLRSTYLLGVLRETVDGILHPFYNLHLARTYRSSSDSPNFQNLPIRDPQLAKLLRRAFIPRKGRILVEVDYERVEVNVGACYHLDPTMLNYISDPSTDMHRDACMECFKLTQEQVSKGARSLTKNQFTFPEFYGSYYPNVARGLWDGIDSFSATRADGMGLKECLAEQGITRLGACNPKQPAENGTFERHIQEVERCFWDVQFAVYAQWKKDEFAEYQRKGWMKSLTGFVYQGIYKRNKVANYKIQGSAFHCLLWSLIRVVRWLRKSKMKTRVIGQIHDSLLLDVVKDELDDVLAGVRRITLDELRKAWRWIVVPLGIDIEGSDRNWFEKKELL